MRTGKIARLPHSLRVKLNYRLLDGEKSDTLLPWLNEQPETKETLANHFNGREITKQNLSEWTQGGYQQWLIHENVLAQAQELCNQSRDLDAVSQGRLTQSLVLAASARYAETLNTWDGKDFSDEFQRKLKTLRDLTAGVDRLRRLEQQDHRIYLQREKLEDKRGFTRIELLELFQCWLDSPDIRQVAEKDYATRDDRDLALRELFDLHLHARPESSQPLGAVAAKLPHSPADIRATDYPDKKWILDPVPPKSKARLKSEEFRRKCADIRPITPCSPPAASQPPPQPRSGGLASAASSESTPEPRPRRDSGLPSQQPPRSSCISCPEPQRQTKSDLIQPAKAISPISPMGPTVSYQLDPAGEIDERECARLLSLITKDPFPYNPDLDNLQNDLPATPQPPNP